VDERFSLGSLPQISEINMTPLMDLTFILLITFIITFPMIEQGIPLDLPKATASQLHEDAHKISLNTEGLIYLDEALITMGDLTEAMRALGTSDPDATVYVRADADLQYGKVIKILQILHDAGITKMTLVTQAQGGEQAK
jgi:biopolymer transport protein TolR